MHFEYRVGKCRLYSHEQWEEAYKTRRPEDYLRSLEPCGYTYEVYGVIMDGEEIKTISKRAVSCIERFSEEDISREIELFAAAAKHPAFDRDAFDHWGYFIINSDELTAERVENTIKELEE